MSLHYTFLAVSKNLYVNHSSPPTAKKFCQLTLVYQQPYFVVSPSCESDFIHPPDVVMYGESFPQFVVVCLHVVGLIVLAFRPYKNWIISFEPFIHTPCMVTFCPYCTPISQIRCYYNDVITASRCKSRNSYSLTDSEYFESPCLCRGNSLQQKFFYYFRLVITN